MLVKKHFTSRNLQNKNNSFETFEKRKDFLITFFLITKSLSLFLVIASPFLPVIARSEATKQSFTAVRHCEPKGWQVCWREAISPLHIPFSIKCFGVIASLTAFARNDEKEEVARNDAPFRHCEGAARSNLLVAHSCWC